MTQPNRLRVFFSSAVFSFRAQFSWLNPPMWLTMKLILPFSQMAFFCLLGGYLVSKGFASSDIVAYMAIGNAIQAMSWNTVFAVINITSADKWDGTLQLMLASPAQRLPLFVGRSMIHIFDGLLSVLVSFIFAAFLFGVDFVRTDLLGLTVTLLLTGFTMAGFGLLVGGFSFYFRDPLVFANIFTFVQLIFCGINFPVQSLPQQVQFISYLIPLTYGVQAGREVIVGATLTDIAPLLAQMTVVGLVAIALGYFFFRRFENSARKTGRLEAI
nr:ABC transporter permease [Candidatus Njordarchaeota archaeon]